MPKKACCCKTCCADYNFTNNVFMIDDIMVDDDYVLDSSGNILIVNGDPQTQKTVKVFPINKDDELILFQKPSSIGQYDQKGTEDKISTDGCVCCYGSERVHTTRTRTIRQKYKYIGCSWTWYPPKYAVNGDPNIPQCGVAGYIPQSGEVIASQCFRYALYGEDFIGDVSSDLQGQRCKPCSQINPWASQANEDTFSYLGNIIGNLNLPQDKIKFSQYGWLTSNISFRYPGHPDSIGESCCSCRVPDPRYASPVTADTSCWNDLSNADVGSNCSSLEAFRNSIQLFPLRVPKSYASGSVWYSPFYGRTNSSINSHIFNLNETFQMGTNVPNFGEAYFIKNNLISNYYTASSGGFKQNNCSYCGLSPYLRTIALNTYPWAFDIFCAGGGGYGSPAKTLDLGTQFIRTGFKTFNPDNDNHLYRQNLSNTSTEQPANQLYILETYKRMLGESTFYSQFIGLVTLEHYFHYMGSNLDDVNAAGPDLPDGVGYSDPNDPNSNSGQTPESKWGYWLTRTTPRCFIAKSSSTPLFHFDLVYAEYLGIFDAFADPDRSNPANPITGKMTPEKFLTYFSMFSNSLADSPSADGRGKGMTPPACSLSGYPYVQVVRDIIGAMCEAGIVGTKDHRENIYNEIKQIIETGMQNGESGAYYKPWAPGNAIPVSPDDFNKLKAKYYTPYGRMCTEKEMFPIQGIDGLAQFAPIRKVIPPTIYTDGGWSAGGDIPKNSDGSSKPIYMWQEHTFDPDTIFTNDNPITWKCNDGTVLPANYPSRYRTRDLQYSKFYSGGTWNSIAPDYVNRQLFFRAIPGSWEVSRWGFNCLNPADCELCAEETPCSPYNIYGYGPTSSGSPDGVWYAPSVRSIYWANGKPFYNGILALCNGVAPDNPDDLNNPPCQGAGSRGQGNNSTNPTSSCGYGGFCWDASGSPSITKCTADCYLEENSLCAKFQRNNPSSCGAKCGAKCAQFAMNLNGQNYEINKDIPAKPCGELFGEKCCECIGKSPNDYVSANEWSDILFGTSQKCKDCSAECFVTCPTPPTDSNTYISPNDFNQSDNIFDNVTQNIPGFGGGGGVCSPETCRQYSENGCVLLGRQPCDANCGYNGINYNALVIALQQSNYSYSWSAGTTRTVYFEDGSSYTYDVDCDVCQCSGVNVCYARFGGKVQAFLPDSTTGFYKPQVDPNGYLFYTQNYVNIDAPIHQVSAKSKMAELMQTLAVCNSCGYNSTSPDFTYCICEANNGAISGIPNLLCPGALYAGFSYKTSNGECVGYDMWCKVYKSGRVVIPPIKSDDINDASYQYI